VIPGDPENGYARVDDVGQCRQHAERCPWNHVTPLEPELEKVSVDDNGPCSLRQIAQKFEQPFLDVA